MRWLSKSQINCWKQCPKKWYYQYIDRLPQKPSAAMQRGIRIHNDIEKFYNNIDIIDEVVIPRTDNPDLKEFVKFENKRFKSCINKDGDIDLKYFYPVEQEAKVSDEKLHLRGFIDAVYINPEDDKLIIIDWKTGKYRPEAYSSYRFELAMYKELYEKKTGKEVGYWGIYFVDAGKLFFEKVKPVSIKAMYKNVEKAREGMEGDDFPCKPGILCKWCNYNDKCQEWR